MLSNTNNGNPTEVIATQIKIMKHTCSLYTSCPRHFPFTQLGQLMNLVADDNILSVDEVKQDFMDIIAKGNDNFLKRTEKKEEDVK